MINLVENPLICIILPAAMSLQQLPSTVVFSFVSLMVLHISGNTFGQGDETTLRGGSLYTLQDICLKKTNKKTKRHYSPADIFWWGCTCGRRSSTDVYLALTSTGGRGRVKNSITNRQNKTKKPSGFNSRSSENCPRILSQRPFHHQ